MWLGNKPQKNNISNFLLNLENSNKKKLYQYGLNGLRYSHKKLEYSKNFKLLFFAIKN